VWVALSLVWLADSLPAAASVIVPVSITRGATAYSGVADGVSGTQDVHNDLPPSSTNPSLTYSLTANGSSSLAGWSASASANSGPVSLVELGPGRFGVRISVGAFADVDENLNTCSTYDCSGYGSSTASLGFTFDLTAPVHVDGLTNLASSFHGGSGMSLSNASQVFYSGSDLAPGRYTLAGSANAFANVQYLSYQPNGYAGVLGYFDYTVIPEPSSGLLASLGLLGLGSARRARARRP